MKVTVPLPANGLVGEVGSVGVTFQLSLPFPVTGSPVAVVHTPAGVTASELVIFLGLVVMHAEAGPKVIWPATESIEMVSVLAPRTV